jgi:hypothetical protein
MGHHTLKGVVCVSPLFLGVRKNEIALLSPLPKGRGLIFSKLE